MAEVYLGLEKDFQGSGGGIRSVGGVDGVLWWYRGCWYWWCRWCPHYHCCCGSGAAPITVIAAIVMVVVVVIFQLSPLSLLPWW
jgi:hypothetical protein